MRRPRRSDLPILVVIVLVIAVAVVFWVRETGDDDPFADYCSEVEAQRSAVGAALGAGERTGLIRALPSFEALADKAPDDISDEWSTVLAKVTALRDALAAADVDPASYDAAKPPQGLDEADRKAIQAAGIGLGSQEMARALAGVQQQARDVCKTPLGL